MGCQASLALGTCSPLEGTWTVLDLEAIDATVGPVGR